MPDVAFDSERHAQVSDDMSAGGGELTTSATSAMMLAAAQIFGHWTTESAAQSMGNTVQSFLTSFSTSMLNEAQYLSDLDARSLRPSLTLPAPKKMPAPRWQPSAPPCLH